MFTSHRARLLVATPELGAPNFDRTVVLLLEHTPEGAVGLVLNRPSGTALDEVGADWDGWEALAAPPAELFVGGPVSRTAVICLARLAPGTGEAPGTREAPGEPPVAGKAAAFQPILGDVGVVDLSEPPVGVSAVRLFAGYAGWGAGQLEGELDAGAWFILDALPVDALTDEPESLWTEVLRRQGGRLALFAACPPDPSLN